MPDQDEPTLTAGPSERRKEPRQPILKSAEIHAMGKVTVCTARDISPSGAGLEVKGLFIAPEHFDLLILDSGQRRSVEKRWQNGNQIGVRFLAQAEA
jgi:hypothetical protein